MKNVYSDPGYAKVTRNLKQRLLTLREEYKDTDESYPEMQDIHAGYWSSI